MRDEERAKNSTLRGVFLGGALLDEYPRVHTMIAELTGRAGTGELRVVIDKTFLVRRGRARIHREPPGMAAS